MNNQENKMELYKHCTLEKGNISTHSWIPERFAIIGKIIRLKKNEEWESGWCVKTASNNLVPGTLIENQAHNCSNIWDSSSKLTNRGNK